MSFVVQMVNLCSVRVIRVIGLEHFWVTREQYGVLL